MRIYATRAGAVALTLAGLLVVQNCSQLIPKLTQDIPVTSNPLGAMISVDGTAVGQAPLNLTLRKNRNHTIRIEMDGYHPTELRVRRKVTIRAPLEFAAVPIFALGTSYVVFLVQLLATNAERSWEAYNRTATTTFWITSAVGTAGWILDMTSGANHSLSPRTVDVALTKAEGPGPLRVNVVQLDASQLRDIRWIRINLSGGR